jgi:hypothetical protein
MNSQKEAERKEQNEKVVDGLAIVSILKLRLTTNHSRNNGNLDWIGFMKPMKIWLVKLLV